MAIHSMEFAIVPGETLGTALVCEAFKYAVTKAQLKQQTTGAQVNKNLTKLYKNFKLLSVFPLHNVEEVKTLKNRVRHFKFNFLTEMDGMKNLVKNFPQYL